MRAGRHGRSSSRAAFSHRAAGVNWSSAGRFFNGSFTVSTYLMHASSPHAAGVADLLEVNRRFYDPMWTGARLVQPQRFNTWPLVCSLVSRRQSRLEVAPGLRPRLPLEHTHFLDFSAPAVKKLRARGATAMVGLVSA